MMEELYNSNCSGSNNNSSGRVGSRVGGYNCHQLLLEEEGTPYPPSSTEAFTEASSTYSIRGIHRNKHAIRFIFRSFSFLVLIGGYSVRNHYYGGDNIIREDSVDGGGVEGQSLRRRVLALATADATAAVDQGAGEWIDNNHILGDVSTNINNNNFEEIFVTTGREATNHDNNNDRQLKPITQLQTNSNSTTDNNSKANCVETKVANPPWLAVFYAIGVIYMFLALAIVCDEFFVPALEEISSDHHLNLSMDVAGATLMAAGGSAPELFTSFVGTFQQSDIGIGTIVGSAVFNVLFVIGCCSMLSKEVLTLTWWPLFRDSVYYTIGLLVLSILVGVIGEGMVVWWEALILLLMYVGYVLLMWYNRRLYKKLTGKELVLAGEEVDGEGAGGEDDVGENDGADNTTAATVSATASGTATSAEAVMENGEGVSTKASSIAVETDGSLKNDDVVNNNDNNNGVNELLASPRSGVPRNDFRWPKTFRAGVLKLLLHPESWVEKGGLGIVSKIQGDVDTVFKKIDTDNSGAIDREELKQLFLELGHEISDDEFDQVFQALDLDGNGTICEEEFAKWYISSEERILSKVKPIFDQFDTNASGTIERDEVRELLRKIEPRVTEEDVDDAIEAMYKSGSKDEITYEEFADWYVHSLIYTRQQKEAEKQIEEESHGVCEALKPPRGEGIFAWLKYLLVLPLVFCLSVTIPDVRRPGLGKWCYLAFVLSIVWIGIFSYFMVTWAETVGNTVGIPSVIMGLTFLAAGTSVPDLLSSVIVARMGEGDMAVSSSIGSNIFDILVGLPLPWLIFTLWPSTPNQVVINADGIWIDIFILIAMLVAIVIIVHCQGWKMTRTLGGIMFFLYFAFLAQAITRELLVNPCFG